MYTQAILLKAKRAKRKSARIEDDVAEMYVHGLLNNWKVRNKHRKKGGGNGEKNKVTLELYVINSEFLAFVDSEDMKEAPSRLLLLREVHIPMSAVNIECAVTLYQASAWSWLEKLIKRFVHLVQEFKRKREMMGIGRQLHVSTHLLWSILHGTEFRSRISRLPTVVLSSSVRRSSTSRAAYTCSAEQLS